MNEQFDCNYTLLGERLAALNRNEITEADIKSLTAPIGIYPQRNDLYMVRIRVPGGHFPLERWRAAAEIMATWNVGFAHLSSRQDLQLHDVPPDAIHNIVLACHQAGMIFQGGGGDTFRNIAASPDSGLSADEVFDITPHVQSLTQMIFDWPKAYKLPRKLKIGFSAGPRDEAMAAIQDLGFVAAVQDGQPGFKVYGGGGMGNASAFGVKLFDFIPVGDVPRCAWAMVELFDQHGNREQRNQARIRFIVARLGEAEFVRLFRSYFDQAPTDFGVFPTAQPELTLPPAAEEEPLAGLNGFAAWLKTAVTPTRFGDDLVTVRLRVPGGRLTAPQLDHISVLAALSGNDFLRLTASQDLLLPLVHRAALPMVYRYLTEEISESDLTLQAFAGQVVSCIGASVCKIGVLDAPAAAEAIGRRLDEYFADRPGDKAKKAAAILDAIRVSGCPNSCSGHPAAIIGLQGMKRKFNAEPEPAYRVFRRCGNDAFKLSEADGADPIPATEVAERVMQSLQERGLL